MGVFRCGNPRGEKNKSYSPWELGAEYLSCVIIATALHQ